MDNWEKDKLNGSWWVGGPWSGKKPNEGVSVAKVRTGKLGRGRRWGSWEVGGPWGMDHTIPYHTIPYYAIPYHTILCHGEWSHEAGVSCPAPTTLRTALLEEGHQRARLILKVEHI